MVAMVRLLRGQPDCYSPVTATAACSSCSDDVGYSDDQRLDFAARTCDKPDVDRVIKVAWREGRLIPEEDAWCVQCRNRYSRAQSDNWWMRMLQPARDRHEQNLELELEGGRLLLHTIKAIQRGHNLLLWYSDVLARAVGIPILTPAQIQGNQQYRCTGCYATFQHPNTLKAHMLFKCSLSKSAPVSYNGASTTLPNYSIAFLAAPFCKDQACCSFSIKPLPLCSTHKTADTQRGVSDFSTPDAAQQKLDVRKERSNPNQKTLTAERRSVTPDSSTDQILPLSPSVSRMICSSAMPTSMTSSSLDIRPWSFPATVLGSAPVNSTHASAKLLQSINSTSVPIALDQHSFLRFYYPWISAQAGNSANLFCSPLPDVSECRSQHPPRSKTDKKPSFFSTFAESLANVQPPNTPHPMPEKPACASTHGMSPQTASSGTMLPSHQEHGKANLSFLTVPSDRDKEPLDMLPPSFFASKSRKGHLCIYCGKLYSRKYGLKIHLRTHTGYKPLKCKVCLRPFGDPSNLNKHVRLHAEGDTPYRCDFCGKVLVRRRDLERHVRSRHPSSVTDDIHPVSFTDSEPEIVSESESSPSPSDGQKM